MSSDKPISRRSFIRNIALIGTGVVVGGAAIGALDRTLFQTTQPSLSTTTTSQSDIVLEPVHKAFHAVLQPLKEVDLSCHVQHL